jgi:hypothetical protein
VIMSTRILSHLPRLMSLVLLWGTMTAADDIVSVARATASSSAAAVVTLRCTIKLSFTTAKGQKQDQDHKLEMTATCVDPSGIFITNYTELNPTERIQMMFNAQNRQMRVDAAVADLSILFSDGSEKPADVVVSNKDLDVVFVRLKDKAQGLTAINLDVATSSAQALDQAFVIGRGLKSDARTPILAIGRLLCQVKGPAPYYLGDNDLSGFIGSILFTADGKPLGIETYKSTLSEASDVHGIVQESAGHVLIRPADQLSVLAKQALTASVQTQSTTGPFVMPLAPVTP